MLAVVAAAAGGCAALPQVEAATPCDLLHKQCNSVANKVPAVTAAMPAGTSVEAGLSAADKETFEHLLGQGFRASPAVNWATTEFTKRALAVVMHGASGAKATDAAILSAFADPKFNHGNTSPGR